MTVIAFRDGILCSDSQVSSGNSAWACVKKIKRVRGWLIGAAGDLDLMTSFLQTFNPDIVEKGKNLPAVGAGRGTGDVEALIISPDGEINFMENSGVITKIKTEGFIAIGVGAECAMSAMAAGADAITAVKIACRYATGCGGKLYKLTLKC